MTLNLIHGLDRNNPRTAFITTFQRRQRQFMHRQFLWRLPLQFISSYYNNPLSFMSLPNSFFLSQNVFSSCTSNRTVYCTLSANRFPTCELFTFLYVVANYVLRNLIYIFYSFCFFIILFSVFVAVCLLNLQSLATIDILKSSFSVIIFSISIKTSWQKLK